MPPEPEHAIFAGTKKIVLGTGFDFAAMEAEIASGVLTVTVPKRAALPAPSRFQRVA